MKVVEARNVNEAFRIGLSMMLREGELQNTRNGPARVMPTPVTTVYNNPWERVLFDSERDANPFFHLMESVWMLAGRRDAAFLTRYAMQLREYAEEDGNIHGAYGYRWRRHFGFNQLHLVVEQLKRNPNDRQAVIQMWDHSMLSGNPEFVGSYFGCEKGVGPILSGAGDGMFARKDRPCNTHIYLRVNNGLLDMTVCCRSNDMLWGAYGANVVHFSVLQEYLAASIGVPMGRLYQVSNNFHAYDNDQFRICTKTRDKPFEDLYASASLCTQPIVANAETFLKECEIVTATIDEAWITEQDVEVKAPDLENRWLVETVWNASAAHWFWKVAREKKEVYAYLSAIPSDDWRLACANWISRRWK